MTRDTHEQAHWAVAAMNSLVIQGRIAPQIDPSGTAVLVLGLVLSVLLAGVALLTIGYSVVRYWQRRRRGAARDNLREELLGRLYRPDDPEWHEWVSTLTGRELPVLEALLDEYLRELDGGDAETLAGLGDALGITDRANRNLRHGTYYERLDALTWLALLWDPPEIEVLQEHCTGTPRERAAAVRVLYVSNHPAIESMGVDLLLRNATEPFSIFSVDTLYRAAESDPSHLFACADADFTTWDPQLQQQVLLACRHLRTVIGDAELDWLAESLHSPEERTRAEAARTLGGFQWHQTLYNKVSLQTLTSDPSPVVRASVYRMLGEWGDDRAITAIRFAGMTDPNDRARVAAAEALVEHKDDYELQIPNGFADAWSWACAHATFDDLARDISTGRPRRGDSAQGH